MDTPNDTRALTDALRAMAADDAGLGSSARVEERLSAEVRALRGARRRSRLEFGALAAGLTLLLAIPLVVLEQATSGVSRPAPAAAAVDAPFMATPYAASFTGQGQVVRMEVPAATLQALGMAASQAQGYRADTRVVADVLVGEDGVARAIRFVGPASSEQP